MYLSFLQSVIQLNTLLSKLIHNIKYVDTIKIIKYLEHF